MEQSYSFHKGNVCIFVMFCLCSSYWFEVGGAQLEKDVVIYTNRGLTKCETKSDDSLLIVPEISIDTIKPHPHNRDQIS